MRFGYKSGGANKEKRNVDTNFDLFGGRHCGDCRSGVNGGARFGHAGC
jgi:hypothetical protein